LKALEAWWVNKGSKIHKHNYSTFKVCYPEELQSDELGERLEQLIKAGQDTESKALV